MDPGTALVLLLLLACPLAMFWMHGRGHRGHPAHASHGEELPRPATLEELRQVREDVDARIAELAEREAGERELLEAGASSQNGRA